MFKIIAALISLQDLTARLAHWLDDFKDRVVGACLSATTEKLVDNNQKFRAVQEDQQRAAQQANADLEHDIKLAYEAYSKSLNVIGTVCDSQRALLNEKAGALREKHSRLRSLL